MLTWLCWTLWQDRIFIEFCQDQWRCFAGLHKIPISRRLRWILSCSRALVNRVLTTWGPSFLVLSKVNVTECPYHSGPVYMEITGPGKKGQSFFLHFHAKRGEPFTWEALNKQLATRSPSFPIKGSPLPPPPRPHINFGSPSRANSFNAQGMRCRCFLTIRACTITVGSGKDVHFFSYKLKRLFHRELKQRRRQR